MKTISTARRIRSLFSRLLIVCVTTLALANAPAFAQEVEVSTLGESDGSQDRPAGSDRGFFRFGYVVGDFGPKYV